MNIFCTFNYFELGNCGRWGKGFKRRDGEVRGLLWVGHMWVKWKFSVSKS